ncbi:hypothetical protein BGZ95_006149 [Linnemannia exigua]|uniref:Uncharacterized protein n=1 Tax=Linnemannia exigua TaxID=604196 RepID=A0AAD4H8D6_9FUNG|nr:hypothetical protein BGZ95_006149 [Linnemannia exigua]
MVKQAKKNVSFARGNRGGSGADKLIRATPSTTKTSSKSSKGGSGSSSSTSKKSSSSKSSSSTSSSSRTRTDERPEPSSKSSSNAESRRNDPVLSDEESGQESEIEEESDGEDADRLLGLRPTLRVVSKATIKKSWKPVNVKTRTHVQSLVAGTFPAAITQSRGEKRKIEMQSGLNRLMQQLNDCLSELKVPQAQARISYSQLSARNRELEAMLVPDLEHIRDLELRLEQEQVLAEQDEAELQEFLEKKRALDKRTVYLQRKNLHPLLKGEGLSETMDSLCHTKGDYSHLSLADQRLMNLIPLSRHEDFIGSEVRESLYNPDQDVSINKVSKRLGSRLSAIERHSEGLDPFMQLVTAAREKVTQLSLNTLAVVPSSSTPTSTPSRSTRRSYL